VLARAITRVPYGKPLGFRSRLVQRYKSGTNEEGRDVGSRPSGLSYLESKRTMVRRNQAIGRAISIAAGVFLGAYAGLPPIVCQAEQKIEIVLLPELGSVRTTRFCHLPRKVSSNDSGPCCNRCGYDGRRGGRVGYCSRRVFDFCANFVLRLCTSCTFCPFCPLKTQ
jgi:hypothetical protein